MKTLRLFGLAALMALCYPTVSHASVDCNDSCPDGKVMVGFFDGGGASCECYAEGSGDTEVEPYVSEGNESPQAEQTDGVTDEGGEG